MDESTERTPFEQIVELLSRHGVEFVVIGGQAETLFGSARVTFDTDLCYRRSRENLQKLAAALRELAPRLRGAPPDLPFRIDAESLALGSNFTLVTNSGDLDLLGYVEPLGGFEEIVGGAERIRVGNVEVTVIGLDDLLKVKEYLGRPKDREAVMHLLAIKRLRESGP